MSHLFLRRLPARTLHRTLTTTPRLQAWKGSSGEDHITNSKDELDVHSAAAKSGKRDRAEDNKQSSAASERDSRNDNKRAKEDHPEAPGPVIGMNDERGGVSLLLFVGVAGFLVVGGAGADTAGDCRRDIESCEQSGRDHGGRVPMGACPLVDFRTLFGQMGRGNASRPGSE